MPDQIDVSPSALQCRTEVSPLVNWRIVTEIKISRCKIHLMAGSECRSAEEMESDALPAKRLRYSPESKHAPQPQVTVAKSEQGLEAAHMIQGVHNPDRSSDSAASCIKAEASQVASKIGLGQALRATATPWTPAKVSSQAIVKQPSNCWDTGYGPAFFTNAHSLITASENAQAAFGTDIAAHFGQVWHAI